MSLITHQYKVLWSVRVAHCRSAPYLSCLRYCCVLRWSFRYCGEVVRFRVNAFAVCDFKSSFQCTVVCNVAHYPSVQCAVVCMCRPLPISTYLPMLSMLSLCARCKHSRDNALFFVTGTGVPEHIARQCAIAAFDAGGIIAGTIPP